MNSYLRTDENLMFKEDYQELLSHGVNILEKSPPKRWRTSRRGWAVPRPEGGMRKCKKMERENEESGRPQRSD